MVDNKLFGQTLIKRISVDYPNFGGFYALRYFFENIDYELRTFDYKTFSHNNMFFGWYRIEDNTYKDAQFSFSSENTLTLIAVHTETSYTLGLNPIDPVIFSRSQDMLKQYMNSSYIYNLLRMSPHD